MNLLERDLLAELHLAFDHRLHGSLTVNKLYKVEALSLEDTVG